MRQVRDIAKKRWPAALLVSLVLHSGVVVAMRLVEWPPVRPDDPVDPLVVWMSDWRLEEPPQRMLPDAVEKEPETAPEQPEESQPTEAPVTEEASESEADADEPAAPRRSFVPIRRAIDWRAEARRAVVIAREARERSESYVRFGLPFESIEGLDSRDAKNLRELENRYGDSGRMPERNSSGDMALYEDNGCHQIVATGSILLEDANRFSNLVPMGGLRCTRPVEPRSDLFEEQKPEYLR